MEKNRFKNDAKQIVDLAFDTKLFKDDVTRDDMNVFEELIEYLLSSRFDSYVRLNELIDQTNKLKSNP